MTISTSSVLDVRQITTTGQLSAVTTQVTIGEIAALAGAVSLTDVTLLGSVSGTTELLSSPIAGTSQAIFPVGVGTLLTDSSAATLTNKTFDTAGAGNIFRLNGTQVSAITGTGAAVLATSPALVTPNLGTPSAAVLTNATGLPVAGGGTGVATLTAYAPVFGGTTATGPVQGGTTGTTGQLLTSNGPGVLPTFQEPAAGTATLLATHTFVAPVNSLNFPALSGAYSSMLIAFSGLSTGSVDHVQWTLNAGNGFGNERFSAIQVKNGTTDTTVDELEMFHTSDIVAAGADAGSILIPLYSMTGIHKTYTFVRHAIDLSESATGSGGMLSSTGAVVGVRVYTAGGANMDAGTINIYGIK